MKHEPEFSKPPAANEKAQAAKDLAAAYARLFSSEDGKRVLEDLQAKFGLDRPVFVRNDRGQIDMNGGLLVDGQRQVIREILTAIRAGTPK